MLRLENLGLHIEAKTAGLLVTIFIVGVVSGAILLYSFNNNSNLSIQGTSDVNPDGNGPSIGFMPTEELTITNMQFSEGYISVTASNTGISTVTINEVYVNGVKQTYTPQTVQVNGYVVTSLPYAWEASKNYQIKLVSSRGNTFPHTATATESTQTPTVAPTAVPTVDFSLWIVISVLTVTVAAALVYFWKKKTQKAT